MLTETSIGKEIIERLKAYLPTKMRENVIDPPNKPEQITADIIKTKYPDGLMIAGYLESAGEGNMEHQVYSVDCIVPGVERGDILTRFCKICLTGWQIAGTHRFEFHEDKLIAQEAGIVVRKVSFKKPVPAVRVHESNMQQEIDKLNL
jgi:hypothetical protein